jgi:hypothetical protein
MQGLLLLRYWMRFGRVWVRCDVGRCEEVIGKTASVEDLEKLNMMIDFFFAQFKNSNEMIAARVGAAKW